MHVLVLASQKGGAGKTTLSRHLAVEAERAGAGPVVLLDADPQGGLAAWWNRRQATTPVFFSSTLAELPLRAERVDPEGQPRQRDQHPADQQQRPASPPPAPARAAAGRNVSRSRRP